MSFYNFLRDIFDFGGIRQQQPNNYGFEDQWQHTDEFRNPIWQNDEDDDDDNDDFRQPGQGGIPRSGHFNIYSDPFEITRYFENQMDSMLKNFFGFSHDGMMSPFREGTRDHFHHSLPIEPPKQKNLRDEVLKPGYETLESGNFLSPDKEKIDVDLDGKISSDELSKVWKTPSSSHGMDFFTNIPQQSPFSFRSFGQSISTKIIRKSDGTVEEQRTIRDSEGNEEITVTRQIGDKKHTVVTKKDKNGDKTETEIVNSGNEIEPFPERQFPGLTDERRDPQNPLNDFPWHKFFGPNPKL